MVAKKNSHWQKSISLVENIISLNFLSVGVLVVIRGMLEKGKLLNSMLYGYWGCEQEYTGSLFSDLI